MSHFGKMNNFTCVALVFAFQGTLHQLILFCANNIDKSAYYEWKNDLAKKKNE